LAVAAELLDERDRLRQTVHAGRHGADVIRRHRHDLPVQLSSLCFITKKEHPGGTSMTRTCLPLRGGKWLTLLAAACLAIPAWADVGQIKVAKGQVSVDRKGQTLPGQVGMLLEPADVVKTGADGSVGITMRDNSLLSAGPNSILSLDQFEFDPTTDQGRFDARLQRGTLAVVSGRIAKKTPQAMTVRTPSAVLGVRGTEFVVSVDE
jgi:hypothetical protein